MSESGKLLISNCFLVAVFFLPAILFAISMFQFAFVVQEIKCDRADHKYPQIPGPSLQLYFGPNAKPENFLDFPYYQSDWNAIPNKGLCPVAARGGLDKSNPSPPPPPKPPSGGMKLNFLRGLAGNDDLPPVDDTVKNAHPKDPPPPPGGPANSQEKYCMPWQLFDFWRDFDSLNKEFGTSMVDGVSYPAPLDFPHAKDNLMHSNFEGAANEMLQGFQSLISGTIVSFIGLPMSLAATIWLSPRWFWAYEVLLYVAFIIMAARALQGMLWSDFRKKELWLFVFPTCDVEVKSGPVVPVLIFQLAWFVSYFLYLIFSQCFGMSGGDPRKLLGRDPRPEIPKPPPLPFLIALIKSTKPYTHQELEDFVTYLGDPSVNVNVMDQDGFTPLLWACRLSENGCKDFFVEQLLMHPYIDIEYSCQGRNALQWCVAQSTKDLIIAFTKAHLAVKAGHASEEEYEAAGLTFKEDPILLEAESEPPPLTPEESVPVEEQIIEGLPPPPSLAGGGEVVNALELIQAQRREHLIKSMHAVKRVAMVSAALATGQKIPPAEFAVAADISDVSSGGGGSRAKGHQDASRIAENDLANLKAAQQDALFALEAKQKAAREHGNASLQDRLAKRRAEKEAKLLSDGLSNNDVAAELAKDEAAEREEAALELEISNLKDKVSLRKQWAGRMDAALEHKRKDQLDSLRQGAADALNMLEKKQKLERDQAESSLAQRLAARKASRQAELQAKGVSDAVIAEALALEEAEARLEAEAQQKMKEDGALSQLFEQMAAKNSGAKANLSGVPVAQARPSDMRAFAAMHEIKMDADMTAKHALAKQRLQNRLHKSNANGGGAPAIPSSAATILLSQNAATTQLLEMELANKQAQAKKRLMEKLSR